MVKNKYLQILVAVLAIGFLPSCSVNEATSSGKLSTREHEQHSPKDVTDHILYIQSLDEYVVKKGDIDQIYAAIENFYHSLEASNLSDKEHVRIRYWRARAYSQLNELRRQNGGNVNISEVEKAIQDYDYVIASIEVSSYPSVHYFAGVSALNDLGDESAAGKYWLKCASYEHMGCMNIIAGAYFTGLYELEVNYSKSRDLHTKVFDSGTEGHCAGIFSGLFLARMSTFLPQLEYRLEPDEWLRESFEMQDHLAARFDASNVCALEVLNIEAFLIHLAKGNHRDDLLKNVASKAIGSPSTAIANYFLGKSNRAAVDDVLRNQHEYVKCQSWVQLIVYLKLSGTTQPIESYKNAIANSGHTYCATALEWSKVLDGYQLKQ